MLCVQNAWIKDTVATLATEHPGHRLMTTPQAVAVRTFLHQVCSYNTHAVVAKVRYVHARQHGICKVVSHEPCQLVNWKIHFVISHALRAQLDICISTPSTTFVAASRGHYTKWLLCHLRCFPEQLLHRFCMAGLVCSKCLPVCHRCFPGAAVLGFLLLLWFLASTCCQTVCVFSLPPHG
jgi:hypothetical protein